MSKKHAQPENLSNTHGAEEVIEALRRELKAYRRMYQILLSAMTDIHHGLAQDGRGTRDLLFRQQIEQAVEMAQEIQEHHGTETLP